MNIAIIIALIATTGVLGAGIIMMARGKAEHMMRSNILMRWRIILQFIAIILVLIGLVVA